MGLDQAVLQGIENSGGKDIMTKDEVERLLKHGAYDIFKEDKDGEYKHRSFSVLLKLFSKSIYLQAHLKKRATTLFHRISTPFLQGLKTSSMTIQEVIATQLEARFRKLASRTSIPMASPPQRLM